MLVDERIGFRFVLFMQWLIQKFSFGIVRYGQLRTLLGSFSLSNTVCSRQIKGYLNALISKNFTKFTTPSVFGA